MIMVRMISTSRKNKGKTFSRTILVVMPIVSHCVRQPGPNVIATVVCERCNNSEAPSTHKPHLLLLLSPRLVLILHIPFATHNASVDDTLKQANNDMFT